MGDEKKPVVLLGDDGSRFPKDLSAVFTAEGNEVVGVSSLADILKELHDVVPERPRLAVVLPSRFPSLTAVLLYLKNAVSHRVMTCILTSRPVDQSALGVWRKQKSHWKQEGVHHIFDLPYGRFDEIIDEVNGSPVWKLLREALTDSLTGLDNTQGFYHTVVPQLATMRDRKGEDFEIAATVLAIDADKFKSINDTHGHLVGTETIIALAKALRSHVRPSDIVCRYGGDEFLIFLYGMTKAKTAPVAKALEKAVRETRLFDPDGRQVNLSISIGMAEIWRYEIGNNARADLTRVIGLADLDLYEMKRKRDS